MNDFKRMQIRVPRVLREWLQNKATNNSRSMNGEIVELMKKEKDKEKQEENQIVT